MTFTEWIEERRWAANMRQARRWRRKLNYIERRVFDEELMGRKWASPLDYGPMPVSYLDACYKITIDDVCRAMTKAHPAFAGDQP